MISGKISGLFYFAWVKRLRVTLPKPFIFFPVGCKFFWAAEEDWILTQYSELNIFVFSSLRGKLTTKEEIILKVQYPVLV